MIRLTRHALPLRETNKEVRIQDGDVTNAMSEEPSRANSARENSFNAQNACPCWTLTPAGILPWGPLPPGSSKSGFELNSISLCCCCCCCCCLCSFFPGTPRLGCPLLWPPAASIPGRQSGFIPLWLIDVMSLAGLISPSCNSSYDELGSIVSIVGCWVLGRVEGACVMPGISDEGTTPEDAVACVWRAVSVSGATKRGSTSS